MKRFAIVIGAVAFIAAAFALYATDQRRHDLPLPLLRKEGTVISPPYKGGGRGGLAVTVDTSSFVSDALLTRGFALASTSSVPCAAPRAGLVNHHTLASDLLAGFFLELVRCRPDLTHVIILSPDHWQAANAPVVTAPVAFRVGERTVSADADGISRLLHAVPVAHEDAEPFAKEHGVGALVPYLSRAVSGVTVTPVIVSGKLKPSEAEALAAWLDEELARPGTVAIVSTDLSHYLPLERALANDQQTLQALEGSDRAFFERVNDDFTDNGKAIAVVLRALGRTRWRLLAQDDSTAYGGSSGYTTTYATGLWE